MKKIKVIIPLCLALGIALMPAFSTKSEATYMASITSDSIKEKEQQIKNAQKEKENFKAGLNDAEKQKQELETKKDNLAGHVVELDGKMGLVEQNIATLKQQIVDKEELIVATEQEIVRAKEIEDKQYEYMRKRIRFNYVNGEPSFIQIIIESKSFSDILSNAYFATKVYEYDQKMYDDYQQNRYYVELCKEQLEIEKDSLDLHQKNEEEQRVTLENLIDDKKNAIMSYEADINTKEKAIEEIEAEIAAQEEVISTLEAAVAEEKRRIIAQNGSVLKYDGGVFKFPLASYTRVSDDYGMRTHPILGVQQFHNGVDFAAPGGTAIYAAYDGKVVAATYSATMGNYVMIDHGDGLYTIYMHASALYVSKDSVVIRGETIAAVGSTGRSTGNHLHFSVRVNGEYVTPWNYLSQ